ncbi:hypothetical protein E2C01_029604 [Portunus trituberculatus]|uniref:Uncharacterized protein n=1 Tax=Portunus trituberculatus TaxID=210409 RepID=A0A5B7ESD9_PORTR|nr:hypothetical protein [Portunus trituberculatus]
MKSKVEKEGGAYVDEWRERWKRRPLGNLISRCEGNSWRCNSCEVVLMSRASNTCDDYQVFPNAAKTPSAHIRIQSRSGARRGYAGRVCSAPCLTCKTAPAKKSKQSHFLVAISLE